MRPTLAALLPLFLLPLAPITAQGWIDERPVTPARSSPAVVRVSSIVRVRVDGRIARVEVEERFRNSGGVMAEGSYLYPLPGEAQFSDFSLFQGDQELKGEMMGAEQARGIYEGIVRRLKDPALITLAGHGLIRAQVFPIQPGETRQVILRYSQLLAREGNALQLRYAAGSRGDAPMSVRFEIPSEREYATPYSPTHPITTSRRGGVMEVTVASPARGDIALVLPFRRGLVGGSVLTHANAGEDGYALLFLSPPPLGDNTRVPRDLTFVVDVSGSMSGEKLSQAQTALRQAIGSLDAMDRFQLIAFSNGIRRFRTGFTVATPAARAAGRAFVDELTATGGTNLEGAVSAALAAPADAERMSLVFLLTDGIPSVGEQAPDRIAAGAAGRIGRHRIFTFGVGHDVNTYLLDRLAVEGRGAATYVTPGADVGDAVGGVLTKLSRPALSDLRIVRAPVRFIDQAPAQLPDLFFGEELVVLTRYRGTGDGPVEIEGTRNGRRERFTIDAHFPANGSTEAFIPPLWAGRRIGELSRQIRLEGSTPELIAQIRELGLSHGILTEYTSYLVQEPLTTVARDPAAPMPSGAMAAREMTGKREFERARVDAGMAHGNSLSDLRDQVATKQLIAARNAGVSRDEIAAVRNVGGRILVMRNGTLTDIAHNDSLTVTTIAPFSAAWFALAKARPALAEALGAGSPLILAGKHASLKVADGGMTAWSAGALDRFLKEFDGQ